MSRNFAFRILCVVPAESPVQIGAERNRFTGIQ